MVDIGLEAIIDRLTIVSNVKVGFTKVLRLVITTDFITVLIMAQALITLLIIVFTQPNIRT